MLFDNSDRKLPIDFSEVEITRRAYRVGESEYFINRTQVRLRDVVDLLMGTGLGPGSYAIVSQGQIDAILTSKPAERRALFEETAGIGKFLARKNESLRRLERTEQNAIRISDLIAELERRIPELETQMRRARRYRRVSTRVRDLEILGYLRGERDATRRNGDASRADCQERRARGAWPRPRRPPLGAEVARVRTQLYRCELALEELRIPGAKQTRRARDARSRLCGGVSSPRGARAPVHADVAGRAAHERRAQLACGVASTRSASVSLPLTSEIEEARERRADGSSGVGAGACATRSDLHAACANVEASAAEHAARKAERRVHAATLARRIRSGSRTRSAAPANAPSTSRSPQAARSTGTASARRQLEIARGRAARSARPRRGCRARRDGRARRSGEGARAPSRP